MAKQKPLKIYIQDIPEDKSFDDYPDNTLFVLDDRVKPRFDEETMKKLAAIDAAEAANRAKMTGLSLPVVAPSAAQPSYRI